VGGQRHAPAAVPPGKNRYPLYRRLGGPQSRSRQVRKISPPPRFDPQTVQPVASLYTDCAIPALISVLNPVNISLKTRGSNSLCQFYVRYHAVSNILDINDVSGPSYGLYGLDTVC
jgi:hypothetical protein